jgi:hypothetical protein
MWPDGEQIPESIQVTQGVLGGILGVDELDHQIRVRGEVHVSLLTWVPLLKSVPLGRVLHGSWRLSSFNYVTAEFRMDKSPSGWRIRRENALVKEHSPAPYPVSHTE